LSNVRSHLVVACTVICRSWRW